MMRNRKILTLLLVAIALAGTTSYASTGSTDEVWDPNVIADPADTNLEFTAQGANTYAMVDPACGPCVAAQKAQLRMLEQTRAEQRLASDAPVSVEDDGQQ